jgi:hypothetical protein
MATKVVTNVCRVSFPHLFQPRAITEGQPPKYSATILIPKTDTATIEAINKALQAELLSLCPNGVKPPNLKFPIKNGDGLLDKNSQQRPECVGMYVINATSIRKPGIVDAQCKDIMSAEEIYGGCYCKFQLAFAAYNMPTSKGVGCYLNNVQKIKDGEPLAGWDRAQDIFTPVEVEAGVASKDPTTNLDLDEVLKAI